MKSESTHIMEQLKEGLLYVLGLLAGFLAPIFGIMAVVGLSIFLDTATGVWKAKHKGDDITSKGLRSLVSKMFFYQAVVVLIFSIDWFIMNDVIMIAFDKVPYILTKSIAMVLIGIELLSINENYKAVKGISIIDKFKSMLAKGKKFKQKIESFKDESEEEE